MNVVRRVRDLPAVLPLRAPVAWSLLAVFLVGGLACRPDPPLPPDVVARLGSHDITVAELQSEARRCGVMTGATEAETAQLRDALLEGLLDDAALFQRAVESGVDRQPEIQRRVRQLIVHAYRERESGTNSVEPVGEAEMQRAYVALAPRFTEPGAVRFGLIWARSSLHATPERRAALRVRLEAARACIDASPDPATAFREQVELLSEDQATRFRGGDSGWLPLEVPWRWPEEVAAAAHHLLKPGDLSPVVETPSGFFLLRLGERRPPHLQPLPAVRAVVEREARQALAERRSRELRQRARAGLVPRLNPIALAKVELLPREPRLRPPPPPPPALPASDHASAPGTP